MLRILVLVLSCIVIFVHAGYNNDDIDTNPRFDLQYQRGVQAYLENKWELCIELLEKSISGYREYYNVVTKCRMDCEFKIQREESMFAEDIEDIMYYEKIIRTTHCILNCRRKLQPDLPEYFVLDHYNKYAFMTRRPYEYLHACYYRNGDMPEAVNAVFTFVMGNQNNKLARKNLEYYRTLINIDEKHIKDREEKSFVKDYYLGIENYENERWVDSIIHMERSLYQLAREIDECRTMCEGEFDHGWYPDFMSSIANHYTFTLRCKSNCTHYLSFVGGEYIEDLFAYHYDYLQYSYFKDNRIEEACQAVASSLLLLPSSETMLDNLKFYEALDGVEPSYFTPRYEAKKYHLREIYEAKLLNFVNTEFQDGSSNPDYDHKLFGDNTAANEKNDNVISDGNGQCPAYKFESGKIDDNVLKAIFYDSEFRLLQAKGIVIKDKNFHLEYFPTEKIAELVRTANYDHRKYKNLMKSEFHSKPKSKLKRFMVDEVISEQECQHLMNLLEIAASDGDGYDGVKQPHSDLEIFAGLSLARLALLSYYGIFDASYLKELLNLTQKAKEHIEYNFNIPNDKPLYFTYTHLACRRPMPGAEFNETTLSHPVHADNCIISANNNETCLFEAPAYTWRDYSAIIYLNSDFEGGEFIFSDNFYGTEYKSAIKPKCGRLLAFTSGKENQHGIKSVTRGTRCALGLWFTHDETHKEIDQELAPKILKHIESKGSLTDKFSEYFLKN